MHYYLGQYVGTGADADLFRPQGIDGAQWSAIDLRPNGAVISGRCLVAVPVRNDAGIGGRYLGQDALDATVPALTLSRLGNDLGVTFTATTLRTVIQELLTVLGGAGRWRNIAPTRLLTGVARWQIFLGGPIIDLPVVSGGSGPFFESWNQADAANWGPIQTWTRVNAAGTLQTTSSRASNASAASSVLGRAEVDAATNDNECRASATVMELSASSQVQVRCRHDAAADTSYIHRRGGAATLGAFDAQLTRRVAAVGTLIGGPTTVARIATGSAEDLFVSASGSTIVGALQGVQLFSVTDTGITTGTRGGLTIGTVVANLTTADDFQFGDLGTTGPPPGPFPPSLQFARHAVYRM